MSGRDGKRVEVQIRTREMHEVAEAGVAAHWSYREGVRAKNPFAVDPAKWIAATDRTAGRGRSRRISRKRQTGDVFRSGVLLHARRAMWCNCRAGRRRLDYAYSIHTRIGNSCVSAKIDGIRVPLWTRLKNGQSVEIITAEGQRPQASLDRHCHHGPRQGRDSQIPARRRSRRVLCGLGQELARAAFEHVGKKATDKALRTAAKMLGMPDEAELLAALGAAELTARKVVETLYPELIAARRRMRSNPPAP